MKLFPGIWVFTFRKNGVALVADASEAVIEVAGIAAAVALNTGVIAAAAALVFDSSAIDGDAKSVARNKVPTTKDGVIRVCVFMV
jgi:hypothetical protein